jgi:hypothetical protein
MGVGGYTVETFNDAAQTAFRGGVAKYLGVSEEVVKIVSFANSNVATLGAIRRKMANLGAIRSRTGRVRRMKNKRATRLGSDNFVSQDASQPEAKGHDSLPPEDFVFIEAEHPEAKGFDSLPPEDFEVVETRMPEVKGLDSLPPEEYLFEEVDADHPEPKGPDSLPPASRAVTVDFIIAVEEMRHPEPKGDNSLPPGSNASAVPDMSEVVHNIDRMVNDPAAAQTLTEDLQEAGLDAVETIVPVEVVIPSPPPPPYRSMSEDEVKNLPRALDFHADVYMSYFDDHMNIEANGTLSLGRCVNSIAYLVGSFEFYAAGDAGAEDLVGEGFIDMGCQKADGAYPLDVLVAVQNWEISDRIILNDLFLALNASWQRDNTSDAYGFSFDGFVNASMTFLMGGGATAGIPGPGLGDRATLDIRFAANVSRTPCNPLRIIVPENSTNGTEHEMATLSPSPSPSPPPSPSSEPPRSCVCEGSGDCDLSAGCACGVNPETGHENSQTGMYFNPSSTSGDCCAYSIKTVERGAPQDHNVWCQHDNPRTSELPSPPPPLPPPPAPPPNDWCTHHADGSGCAAGTKCGRKPPHISEADWSLQHACDSCTGKWNPFDADGCCAYSSKTVVPGTQRDLNVWCEHDNDRTSESPSPPPPVPPPPSPPPSDICHYRDNLFPGCKCASSGHGYYPSITHNTNLDNPMQNSGLCCNKVTKRAEDGEQMMDKVWCVEHSPPPRPPPPAPPPPSPPPADICHYRDNLFVGCKCGSRSGRHPSVSENTDLDNPLGDSGYCCDKNTKRSVIGPMITSYVWCVEFPPPPIPPPAPTPAARFPPR